MRASVGYRQLLIKAGALLATTATAAASLLFMETPESSAQTTVPTSYTPHLITVSPNGQLKSRLGDTSITYDFNTELYFEDIEPKLLESAGSTAPFQDACWFENDVTTWTSSDVAIDAAQQTYGRQTCFPIKKLAVSTSDSPTSIVVTPADSIAYQGNSDIELTYEIPEGETVEDAISNHVVFRFADPTLTTRFTYYLPSPNPLNVSVTGPSVYRMKDEPGAPARFTQLVSKPDAATPTYQTTATVTLNRTANSAVSAHQGSSITATQTTDISTASQTQQQWKIVAGKKPSIDLSGVSKSNFKLSAQITNSNVDFSNDSTQDTSFDPKKGGTRAYVRKIFAGTGYGNPVTGNSTVVANNLNGCTINGSRIVASQDDPGLDATPGNIIATSIDNCKASIWKNEDDPNSGASSSWHTMTTDSDGRLDTCYFTENAETCGDTIKNGLKARFYHALSGAGGGCLPTGSKTDENFSGTSYPYWDYYYSLAKSPFCWQPTSAAPLNIGNASAAPGTTYKIWFDHVENGTWQENIYNKFLSELTINGEPVNVPFPKICIPDDAPNKGSNYITNTECQTIAQQYSQLAPQMGTTIKDAKTQNTDFYNGKYKEARNRLLGMANGSPAPAPLITYTFTSGKNAGTTVKVKLVNARIAGEWKGTLDDLSPQVDYTGYCAAGQEGQAINITNIRRPYCSFYWNTNGRGLLWSTRYEVEIINPQVENMQVNAFYYKTSQNRLTAYGSEGVYSTSTTNVDNVQTWSLPGSNNNNQNPNSWVKLCEGGETAQAEAKEPTSRTTQNHNCGYSYLQEQYSPRPYGNATIRFRIRNGYYQPSLTSDPSSSPATLSLPTFSSTGADVSTSRLSSAPSAANDPENAYAYFGADIPTQSKIEFASPYAGGTNPGYDPGNAKLGLGSVTNFQPALVPRVFNIEYLNSDGSTPIGLTAESRSVARGSNTFEVKRPSTLSKPQRFSSWKLVWCSNSTSASCEQQTPAYYRTTTTIPTGTVDKDGNEIFETLDAQGDPIENILPGEIFDISSVYGLTSPTGDLNYNTTHNHLAFVADTELDQTQTPIYGAVRKIDQGSGDEVFTESLFELFSGLPSLKARMLNSLWDSTTYRNPYTYNGVQYSFDEARSNRAAALNEDEPFPVWFLYSIRNLVVRQKWVVDGGTPSDTAPDGVTAALSLATGAVTQANSTWGQVYSTLTDGTTSATIPDPPGTVNVAITPTASGTCSVDSISLAKTDSSAVGTNPTAGANNTWTYATESSPLAADFTATFAVTCVHPATLRLVRAVTNIPNDVIGSLTTEVVDTWTAQQPASTDLTPTESTGDTKVYSISDTSTAVSLKSSSTNTMVAPIENWTCLVTGSDPQQPVTITAPTNDAGTRTSTASIQLEANQDVTCTTTFGTSEVQSAAANITAGNTGTTPTLSSDVRLNFTALDANDQPLTTADDRGALISDGVIAALTTNTDTPTAGTNLVRVRPDTSIQIKPSGNLAGLLYGIEEKQANGEWSALPLNSDGAAIIENIEGANLRVFRLAIQPAPTFPLPLTGGRPADLVLLAGAVLAAVGAATGVGMSRRKAHAAQL